MQNVSSKMINMIFQHWAEASSKNAISLAEESRILLNSGKKERAYYLSHMASEEASKAIILKFCNYLSVPESEISQVEKLLRNHQKKIDFIIKMAAADDPEIAEQIEKVGKELITHINNLKNNSMYVTRIDNVIKTPVDTISKLVVEDFVAYGEVISRYANTLIIKITKDLVVSPLT